MDRRRTAGCRRRGRGHGYRGSIHRLLRRAEVGSLHAATRRANRQESWRRLCHPECGRRACQGRDWDCGDARQAESYAGRGSVFHHQRFHRRNGSRFRDLHRRGHPASFWNQPSDTILVSGGDWRPFNLTGVFSGFEAFAGQDLGNWGIGITDAVGVAVEGSLVGFSVTPRGSVTFKSVPGQPECSPSPSTATTTCATDAFGFAWVDIVLGPSQPRLV